MRKYSFTEATPLIEFLEKYQNKIVGSHLKNFYIDFWPDYESYSLSCNPVVLELDDFFVVIHYLIPSDMDIVIGTKEEVSQNKDVAGMINIKNELVDYYNEEFSRGVKKEEIENCKITKIDVKRFSHEFECNPVTGEMRPEGGDYFSTIHLYLDSGTVLCFCGADSITDGYIEVWCE